MEGWISEKGIFNAWNGVAFVTQGTWNYNHHKFNRTAKTKNRNLNPSAVSVKPNLIAI